MNSTLLKQPISKMTLGQLIEVIEATVRKTVSEEFAKDYYITQHGTKVLKQGVRVNQRTLRKFRRDSKKIKAGKMKFTSSEEFWKKAEL
jgi:hypothetical protein